MEVPQRNIGMVDWFDKKKGYGFVLNKDDNDKQIFVHLSAITTTTDCYKLLFPGEYIEFTVGVGKNGNQCEGVTGVSKGPLQCETLQNIRNKRKPPSDLNN